MNASMTDTFKEINIYEKFKEYDLVAPKNRQELERFQHDAENMGFTQLAEFIEMWRVALDYYIINEHDNGEEISVPDFK